MLPREVCKLLYDMAEAADLVAEFVAGKTFDEYVQDAMLRSAVERQFEIIGEALNNALKLAPNLRTHIAGTERIIAFRNRLIHGYASVSSEIVWGIVEGNVPRLRRELAELLPDASGHG
jgi:uncharacterized protein with HEPN domain